MIKTNLHESSMFFSFTLKGLEMNEYAYYVSSCVLWSEVDLFPQKGWWNAFTPQPESRTKNVSHWIFLATYDWFSESLAYVLDTVLDIKKNRQN